MKFFTLIYILFLTHDFMHAQTVRYPVSPKMPVKDIYHNVYPIEDPYRWLENDTSNETKTWVKNQNAVTFDYLGKIPYREAIKRRITKLNNYPKYSSPFRAGEFYMFYKNDGLQNQSVLYIQKGLEGTPEVFLDPNTMSKGGTVSLGIAGFSKDKKYMAYTLSKAGSDWQEIYIMEVATKKQLSDKIEWVKFSGATWSGNGFYYARYDEPLKGTEFSSQNKNHKIYYHKLGDPQKKDKLIYTDPTHPLRYFGTQITEDGRFLILNISEGTYGTELHYADLSEKQKLTFKTLFPGFEYEYEIIDNVGGELIVLTNHGAPRRKIIRVNPKNPSPENWVVVVPESKDLLQSASTGGMALFCNYLHDASTRIIRYNYDGSRAEEIELPGIGTAGGLGGEHDEKMLFLTFTSFNYPPTIFQYQVDTREMKEFSKTKLPFDPSQFESRQEFAVSRDGTKVPMFIVYKKGMELKGNNPTLLYGYGGFNINLTPSFSASRIAFLEAGGIYVMANLRGGGEYGEEWHKAGMTLSKQNVFDDFIACAEYLIQKKYTSSQRLAIQGGSNGGLLVGACMAQRPDLFRVALPAVGVMDMLRYHKFTVGWGWAGEYGTSDSLEHFRNLLAYSPLHNIKTDVEYPATLVTTADHDDRVVPAHSFKFIATLQEKQSGPLPVLIRIETDAGHGAGKPISKSIEEIADLYSFIFWNMKVNELRIPE